MNRRAFLKGAVVASAAMASTEAFADNYQGSLNYPSKKDDPSELEQKHVPAAEAPGSVKAGEWFDVMTVVGFKKVHPSTPKHWITMIKLHIDGKEIGQSRFRKGGLAGPIAIFRAKLEKTSTLVVIANCNLHGNWASEPVTVKVV